MFLKRCLILFCMLSLLTLAAVAESPLSFPCDSELSPFLSRSEHDVTFKIDLENNYRINGALGRNRTTDTEIFSLLLYRLSYQGKWRRGRGSNPRPPA